VPSWRPKRHDHALLFYLVQGAQADAEVFRGLLGRQQSIAFSHLISLVDPIGVLSPE
jgi:hypothetical protein